MTDTDATPTTSGPTTGLRHRLGLSNAAIALLVLLLVVAVAGAWLIGLDYVIAIGLVVIIAALTLAMQALRIRRKGTSGTFGFIVSLLAGTVVTLGVLNLIPATRDIPSPPVTGEPQWDSARTEELVRATCYDCHSNKTVKPWYANVAPMSLALKDHVEEGRDSLNFTEWDAANPPRSANDVIEVIREGSMPPAYYTRFGLHSKADLSTKETEELIAGLKASGFRDEGGEGEAGEGYEGHDGDDDGD